MGRVAANSNREVMNDHLKSSTSMHTAETMQQPRMHIFWVSDLECESCSSRLEQALLQVKGVNQVSRALDRIRYRRLPRTRMVTL